MVSRRVPNTFRVSAHALRVLRVHTRDETAEAMIAHPDAHVFGDGSNVLFARDLRRTAVLQRGSDLRVTEDGPETLELHADAGVVWDELVRWSTARGLWGIENLALIPGRCGAAPMQNIGAYGAQLSDVLISVDVWCRQHGRWETLSADELELGYRDSLLRRQPDRYVVQAIALRLQKEAMPRLEYPGLAEALTGVAEPTSQLVADAVTRLRRRKLPDPETIGNAGSFFKNPIVTAEHWQTTRERDSELIAFPEADGRYKLSAARLLERCGWKGRRVGDAGFSAQHALVLVNHGGATGQALLDLALQARDSVAQRYGIELEPEPVVYR